MPARNNILYFGNGPLATRAGGVEPAPVMPAWRTALAATTWAQIGSNDIMDLDPEADAAINPNGTTNAPWTPNTTLASAAGQWGGGTLDDVNGRVWFCNGGHFGYYGNEAYSMDLSAGAPAWIRRGYPSGSIQHPIADVLANGANNSIMTDGRPHQVHAYNLLSCLSNGDLVLAPSGAQWQGNFTVNGYVFSHADDDWDTAQVLPVHSRGSATAGSSCYDATRGVVWVFTGDTLASYNTTTWAKTEHFHTNGNQTGYYSCMVHDTTRDLIVIFLGAAGGGPFSSAYVLYFDPDSPTAFTIAPQDNTTRWGTYGMGYHAATDRYITWDRTGNNLTVITPPATSPGTNTWVSSTLTCSGTVTAAATNGNWGRFQVSNKYNCVLLLNATGEKLHALALS